MCIRRLSPLVLFAALLTAHPHSAWGEYGSFDRSLLTSAEQAWLAAHPVIYEAEPLESEIKPLRFRNSQGATVGITADYVAVLSQRLGVKIQLVYYPTVEAAMAAVNAGRADFKGTLIWTPDRAQHLSLSMPYRSVHTVLVVRADDPRIRSAADLPGRRLAVIRADRSRELITNGIRDVQFVEAPNAAAAMDLVRSGQVDAYITDPAIVKYFIHELGWQSLDIRGPVVLMATNLVFVVRPDAPELLSMINRVLASMSESERHAIESRWAPDLPEAVHLRTIIVAIWPYLAALAGVLAVVLAWNQSLRVQVRHRRAAERHARVAQERAEAADRAKSAFVASVSHEIRNPLHAVLGMAQRMTANALTDRQREDASRLYRSAGSMLGILNDLLDLSKIEAGRLEIESVPFDLSEVLEHLGSLLGQQASAKALQVLFAIPPALPTSLVGDPLRLGQILLNLGGNAIKFTPTGTVVLRIEERSRSEHELTLRFSVSDTGIGMTEDQLARLFQPFAQGDESISRRFGGTGLGLAISQQLVTKLGGRLEARSVAGEGSEFSFESAWSLQTPTAVVGEIAMTGLGGARLLIVNNSAPAREVLAEMATALELQVDAAEECSAAAQLLEAAAAAGPERV
jgi:signal transduction histidine kinase